MHSQDLFTALFNTDPVAKNNRDMLKDITQKYPYFSAAHFFLLKNTNNADRDYDAVAAKTALHFGNPFLLNYRLKKVETVQVAEEVMQVEEVEKVNIVEEVNTIDVVEGVMPEEKDEAVNKVDIVEEAKQEELVETVDTVEQVKPLKVEQPAVQENTEEMIFEPLFASDYFASQGIKLSDEVKPGDKLGKQLKSFTEWLKTMKKVHEQKQATGNEPVDVAVQKLAEKSNEEAEILTESMAEAYLQQGKAKKAREIFEKLSLFNPSKSAYFAAKIDRITADQQ